MKHTESCIGADEKHEMLNVLRDILHRSYVYEQLAVNGREAVLTEHGRENISKQFFEMFQVEKIEFLINQ